MKLFWIRFSFWSVRMPGESLEAVLAKLGMRRNEVLDWKIL